MRQSASAVSTAPTTTRRGDGHERLGEDQARPRRAATVWLRSAEIASSPAATIASASSSGTSPVTPSAVTNGVRAGVVAVDHGARARRARRASPSRRSARSRPRSRRRRRGRRPRPRRSRCRRRRASGGPPSSTLCASPTTAPSTQPPETEPAISPREPTANLEPSGRGAERRVRTTVASATSSPRVRQRSAVRRVSSFMRYCRSVPRPGRGGASPISSSTSASVSSARRLWPGRKWSTYGSAACMPATSGR